MDLVHRWNRSGRVVYLCLAAWLAYYLLIPSVFLRVPVAGIAAAVLVGPYIGIWVIYLMHECWHRYFDGIDNRRMFVLLCAVMFTQPGAYGVGHRSHHRMVNSYDDREIHPVGRIHSRARRMAYYTSSFVFGSLVLLFLGLGQAGSDESAESRYDKWMPLAWVATWGAVGSASHALTGAPWTVIALAYGLSIWATSFFHRHNEMLEHGGIVAEGRIGFRASLTRNLDASGALARLFLLIVHQDCREHTLHHTRPNTNWRVAPVGNLPPRSASITLGDYARIAGRLMLGIEPPVAVERPVATPEAGPC